MNEEKSGHDYASEYLALATRDSDELRRFLRSVPDRAWTVFATATSVKINDERNTGGIVAQSLAPGQPLVPQTITPDLLEWHERLDAKKRALNEMRRQRGF